MHHARNQQIPSVELFDTSLRDGLQQPNLEISVSSALDLIERMDRFGIHFAEIGFAGANSFVAELAARLDRIETPTLRPALFGRSRGRGARAEDWPEFRQMLRFRQRIPVAVVVVKSRPMDVEKSLGVSLDENLAMARESIAFLRSAGLEVFVDLEHAMDAACGRTEWGRLDSAEGRRASLDYLHRMVETCLVEGAARLVVCDTNGGAAPEEVASVFAELLQRWPARFGFHGHADRGLGVANSRAAVLAGAVQVQGTLLGIGERCGNVNLTTLVGSMQLRDEAEFVPAASLRGLAGLARAACAAFSLPMPHGAPVVGPGAFGTWAGMHGSSERKNPGAYLWCEPASVGAAAVVGVNAQSGRANVALLAETLGVPLTSAQAQSLIDSNQPMIDGGGFTASELSFRLACMRVLGSLPTWFAVKGWRVVDENDIAGGRYVQAAMALGVGAGRLAMSRAEGEGPVDALTKAMRQELERGYPVIARMRLDTFSVAALDVSAHDTAAYVRVTASFHADGHQPWTTAGVSCDLNQAALMAIVDGFEYWLLHNSQPAPAQSDVQPAPQSGRQP